MMHNNKKTTEKLLIAVLALLVLILFSLWLLFKPADKAEEPVNNINDDIEEIIQQEEKSDYESIFSRKQYQDFKDINNDYIGQIIFESGIINEPVVYSDINSYYLRKDINKKYSIQGTIYLDDRNNLNDQNLIIYGHFTEPGFFDYEGYDPDIRPMFTNLDLLLDKENYEANKVVYLFLKDEVRVYEVASVYLCPLYKDEADAYVYVSDGYEYYITSYTDEEFIKYKETVLNGQRYSTDIDISNNDNFLTLQTCVAGRPDLREIVVCKEISISKYN